MKKIPVGREKFALIDDEDYPQISQYLWRTSASGYVLLDKHFMDMCNLGCPSTGNQMSRMILGLKYGDKREADHKNHNILDNRRYNLRIATRAENLQNQRVRKKGSSRYKGVHWNKQSKKWLVQIGINGKTKYLGCFDNENHAAHAYNLAAKRYFGEFALLNKVV